MTRLFTTLFLICFLGLSSQAQDTLNFKQDSIQSLKEVIVTYQADRQTPVTYQNLKAEDLEQVNVGQEPSFILSRTPSITAYSDAGSMQGYSYFRIRGIDQTRINMTFDGVPMNEPEDQGTYLSNYPDILNSVSKIQIQRGVGTTQNGSTSYGGSVQLFSPSLKDSARTNFGLGYGSFNTFRAFFEHNTGVKDREGLYVRASQIYSDGYKHNSSNNSQSVLISSGLYYDKTNWKLNILAGQQQNQLAWLGVADSVIAIAPRTNGNANEKDNFAQTLIQIQNQWFPRPQSLLSSSIYHTYARGNYDFDLNNFLGLPSTGELYNYALQSYFTGAYSNYTHYFKHLTWTAGVHAHSYHRHHVGSERTQGRIYRNTGFKKELSFFSKAEYKLQRFLLFADVQYRYTSFDYKGSVPLNKLTWEFINPKAGISMDITEGTTLYYGIGKTGREPTRNDIFGSNDDLASEDGKALVYQTKPEFVVDQELGIRLNKNRYSIHTNLYYMNFNNEIVLDGNFGPNGLALTNQVEKSIRTGAEVFVSYKINRYFSTTNNSSFNYSRIREQKEVFQPILTPPLIINQDITFTKGKLSLSLTGRYQSRSFIDFANTATVNEYFLLNTSAHYKIRRFQLSLFTNNLTNAKYFNHGYVEADGTRKFFVQAPLNFYGAVGYSF